MKKTITMRLLTIALILLFCICACAEAALPQSIGLDGVGNARELGGYQASDGRTVKHGIFLRTASLAGATDRDLQRLREEYHLSLVIDLRMIREIEAGHDPEIPGVMNLHLGIIDEEALAEKQQSISLEEVEDLDMNNNLDRLRLAMRLGIISDHMYVDWLSSATGKAGYTRMFQELIDLPDGKSLLFHCTQGKDRTGVAAMLILSALGVDESTIISDFLLTNTYNADIIESERKTLEKAGFAGEELELFMKAMDEVDAQYMVNALEWMKENYGSATGYITRELGVSETEITLLRNKYLEGEIKDTDKA